MRYFRARRYIHASKDGIKTLCGLACNTFGSHWESTLWEEVTRDHYRHSPCPKCVKKSEQTQTDRTNGQQTKLNVFQQR